MAQIYRRRAVGVKPSLNTQVDWSNPITNGLVFYAPMLEGGGLIQDVISNQSGVFSGSAGWVNSSNGQVLNANVSATDKVTWSTPSPITSSVTADITMAVWVYTTSFATWQPLFNRENSGGTVVNWAIYIAGSGGAPAGGIHVAIEDPNSVIDTDSAISLNAWHFIVATRVGSTVSVYVDGIAQNIPTPTASLTMSAVGSIYVGNNSNNRDDSSCNIWQTMLWNRALSVTEIRQLMVTPYVMLKPAIARYAVKPAVASGIKFRKSLSFAGSGVGKRQAF